MDSLQHSQCRLSRQCDSVCILKEVASPRLHTYILHTYMRTHSETIGMGIFLVTLAEATIVARYHFIQVAVGHLTDAGQKRK